MRTVKTSQQIRIKKGSVAHAIFLVAKKAPGTLVRAADFPEFRAATVTEAMRWLTEKGVLKRASKGYYYYPKQTLLGPSQPSGLSIDLEIISDQARPTRATAAYLLGLTTQVPARPEYLVVGRSIPTHVRAARLTKRKDMPQLPLTPVEGAWLEVVWDRGKYCELTDEAFLKAMIEHVRIMSESSKEPGKLTSTRSLKRLITAAKAGPPRTRAVLGAMLEQLGQPTEVWKSIKASLNPHSKFDFGPFASLFKAKEWQCR